MIRFRVTIFQTQSEPSFGFLLLCFISNCCKNFTSLQILIRLKIKINFEEIDLGHTRWPQRTEKLVGDVDKAVKILRSRATSPRSGTHSSSISFIMSKVVWQAQLPRDSEVLSSYPASRNCTFHEIRRGSLLVEQLGSYSTGCNHPGTPCR